ncbi:hypothetical protein [Fictibacillus sp. S7]|uniref:hypothetical protein n=1 Tax=Fictibacillus sp. S7 TaxID=2212476 RepID=UPI001013530B|nr:hypothetical protein [Fictibacillus sp. S7]RXZ00838.1 hypothetical protein DMO16_14835 [Fictibacillus sp. S7]
MAIRESSNDQNVAAVSGTNTAGGRGVEGFSNTGQAVYGESKEQAGVIGVSEKFVGVWGESKSGHPGVLGKSKDWNGVYGESTNQAGVAGISEKFVGVWGESKSPGHAGVLGKSKDWQGVHGASTNQAGVVGVSEKFVGIWGESKSPGHAGVFGKGAIAGAFDGNVHISGNLIANGFIYMGGDTVTPLAAWLSRIQQLEAQVADLRSRIPVSGTSAGSTTTTPSATVGVEMIPRTGPFNDLRVFGSGFLPNEPIEITYNSTPVGGNSGTTDATADSLGKFSKTIGVSCSPGIRYTAYARGKYSGRISNTAGAGC